MRSDDEDDLEEEVDPTMDTEEHNHQNHLVGSPHLEETRGDDDSETRGFNDEDSTSDIPASSRYPDEDVHDQMDCDDSNGATMFIDEDSSSRMFPEGGNDGLDRGSPSAPSSDPLPESSNSRRNKRKNFKPRNISVYSFTDSEDNEANSDMEARRAQNCHYPDDYPDPEDTTGCDGPLDLSETPIRPSLMPRRLSDLPCAGIPLDGLTPGRDGDAVISNPRLNALLNRSSSPGHGDDSPDGSEMKDYADYVRRLLGLYGLQHMQDNAGAGFPLPFHPG